MIVFHRIADRCRFLLVLSRLTKRPLWEFPKGGVDSNETLLQTALRELQEEAGLTADQVRLVPGFEWSESYRFTSGREPERTLIHKKVTYYLAESTTMDVRLAPQEISEHAWLELDEALRRIKYKERRRMLKEAAAAAGCDTQPASSAQAQGPALSPRPGRAADR
jgi:8-oxo-dGTP pyrophosphatase MutT (NUDIX family)